MTLSRISPHPDCLEMMEGVPHCIAFINLHHIGNGEGTPPVIFWMVDVQQRINFFQIAAIYLFVIYLVVDLAVYLRTSLKPLQQLGAIIYLFSPSA